MPYESWTGLDRVVGRLHVESLLQQHLSHLGNRGMELGMDPLSFNPPDFCFWRLFVHGEADQLGLFFHCFPDIHSMEIFHCWRALSRRPMNSEGLASSLYRLNAFVTGSESLVQHVEECDQLSLRGGHLRFGYRVLSTEEPDWLPVFRHQDRPLTKLRPVGGDD